MLLLIAAGWYFMWVLGKKKKGFLFAALLICPFGQWYAWNVIYNSYYVPHIVISLVSVAMFIQLLKTVDGLLYTSLDVGCDFILYGFR